MTRGLASAVAASGEAARGSYDRISQTIVGDERHIQGMFFAPDFVVDHVFSVQGQVAEVGADIRSMPGMGDAVAQAVEDRDVIMTDPHTGQSGETVIASVLPVFTNEDGTERLWGVVGLVVRLDHIIVASGLSELNESCVSGLRIVGATPGSSEVIWGNAELFDKDPLIFSTGFPNGHWELAIAPRHGWASIQHNRTLFLIAYLSLCVMLLALICMGLWQARRRLEAESILSSAIDTIDDGFALFDAEDRLVAFNSKFAEQYAPVSDLLVTGTDFETLVREAVRRGHFPEAVGREEEWIASRLDSYRSGDGEFVNRLSNGRWTKVAERVMENGWRVGFRVDITELLDAREEAERANKAKSEFISVLSHELRTPLTIILGYTRVLENLKLFKTTQAMRKTLDGEDPKIEDIRTQFESLIQQISAQASKMHVSGEHLLVLINDMLDFSKIEAGKMDMHIKDVALGSMIHSVVENMHEHAKEKGIELEADADPIRIEADEVRVKQVLINLIGNAIKFTNEGKVSARCIDNGDSVSIQIEDTGIGIKKEAQDGIFLAFHQADNSDVRKAGGTGLGLAISLRIVKLHGGTIDLESKMGVGSVFTVTLPKVHPPEAMDGQDAAPVQIELQEADEQEPIRKSA